MFFEVENDE